MLACFFKLEGEYCAPTTCAQSAKPVLALIALLFCTNLYSSEHIYAVISQQTEHVVLVDFL